MDTRPLTDKSSRLVQVITRNIRDFARRYVRINLVSMIGNGDAAGSEVMLYTRFLNALDILEDPETTLWGYLGLEAAFVRAEVLVRQKLHPLLIEALLFCPLLLLQRDQRDRFDHSQLLNIYLKHFYDVLWGEDQLRAIVVSLRLLAEDHESLRILIPKLAAIWGKEWGISTKTNVFVSLTETRLIISHAQDSKPLHGLEEDPKSIDNYVMWAAYCPIRKSAHRKTCSVSMVQY